MIRSYGDTCNVFKKHLLLKDLALSYFFWLASVILTFCFLSPLDSSSVTSSMFPVVAWKAGIWSLGYLKNPSKLGAIRAIPRLLSTSYGETLTISDFLGSSKFPGGYI